MLLSVSVACAAAEDGYATLYATKSNQELTALSEQWQDLDATARRALLTEVQSRMSQGHRTGGGVMRFRVQRRYGKIVRKPDGSVVRIETKVVQYTRRVTPAEVRRGFGVGFEQRAAQRSQPPAVKVQDQH